ncbi:unnamed protein product [Caenorhabditis auriculariae]|uniref:Uncharacterized protein n=1 Tax=Caenorhabditis auriculariae TaxID=2777116 RepID=A0A8S1HGJ6_9PELO|nr:unnamed protein product [Caenorhabditis auriculariae]
MKLFLVVFFCLVAGGTSSFTDEMNAVEKEIQGKADQATSCLRENINYEIMKMMLMEESLAQMARELLKTQTLSAKFYENIVRTITHKTFELVNKQNNCQCKLAQI